MRSSLTFIAIVAQFAAVFEMRQEILSKGEHRD